VIHIEANKRCLPKGVCVKGTTSHPITVMSKIQKIVENKRGNQKRKRKRELADEHHETSTNAPYQSLYQALLNKCNAQVEKNREQVEKNRELDKENKELVDDKNRELKTNQNNVQQLNSGPDVGHFDGFSPSSSSGPLHHETPTNAPYQSLYQAQLHKYQALLNEYQALLNEYNAQVEKHRELVKKNKELVVDKNRELKTNQNNVQQLNSSLDVGQLDAFSPSSSSGPFLHNAHSPRGSLLLSQLPSSIESLWYNADSSL